MQRNNRSRSFVSAAIVGLLIAGPALAVPYASAVRDIGPAGGSWEFVLNEAADNVTVLRDGGNAQNLGMLTAGRHTFDMTGFNSFEIQVAKSAAAGWTTISDQSNLFTNYKLPTGLAVNRDPSSPYFGTVYVGNSDPAATISGRAMGDGVYALTADLIGVDLANNFAVVADPNDTTQAKAPSWTVSGSASASPWRITLDDAGNLLVSDWSDASGGIKYASPDLASGGLVLAFEDGIRPLFVNGENEEIHGSIASKVYSTGSVGNNLTVYAMDEDFDLDKETLTNATTGNHIWRWDVGNATAYDQPPELVINSGAVGDGWLNLNVGVRSGAHYDPENNKWYLVQNRFDGNQTGLVVVTPDGVDGMSPTREWSSLEFTVENGLDGNTGLANVQDVFRHAGDVTLSPDGTKLFLHKVGAFGANPAIGTGALVVIPLDENGIPDVQINDNGTPGDTTDDTLANVETITLIENDGGHSAGSTVDVDAAGNVYITNGDTITVASPNAGAQLLQVFSPGGNTLAKTSSAGTFVVDLLNPMGVPGDYNDNGVVDAADYTVWRDNLGGATSLPNDDTAGVGADDYDRWKTNFGNTSGSGSALGAGAVPEPGTALAALAALMGAGVVRRRRVA